MEAAAARVPHKDQASRLRELAAGRRGPVDSLAVVSGKGGVGKTNIAVNLAVLLASRGRKVTLVDLDMGLANADLVLGVTPKHTLAQVIAGVKSLDEVAIVGPGGLRFIPGASGLDQLANLSEFERQNLLHQLQNLEDSTDMLVLDCGAGISRSVIRFAQSAQRVMVVTSPEPTAMTDAYATIKTLAREQYRGAVGLLVNRVSGREEAEATFQRIAQVAKRFLNYPIANFGHVVQDRAVALAVQSRSPVVLRYPHCEASACFASLAGAFVSRPSKVSRRDGFFRRIAGLFI